nr:MAG TPA: hypothetical protein [Caudoviricetes sp.]
MSIHFEIFFVFFLTSQYFFDNIYVTEVRI